MKDKNPFFPVFSERNLMPIIQKTREHLSFSIVWPFSSANYSVFFLYSMVCLKL